MYCHMCGKEVDPSSASCCYCGTILPHLKNHKDYQKAIEDSKESLIGADLSSKASYCNIRSNSIGILKRVVLGHPGLIFVLLLILGLVFISYDTKTNNDVKAGLIKEYTPIGSYENEEERWDAESCTYANFKYGIAFNLTRGILWERVSGTAKHTIVKFLQPDSGLTIFVNINPIETIIPTENIWDVYDEFVESYKAKVLPYASSNNGIEITNFWDERSEICGKQAVKIICQHIINDDRYDENISYTTYEYIIIHNNSTICVSATCPNDYVDFFREEGGVTLDDFLASFHLPPINTNHINN